MQKEAIVDYNQTTALDDVVLIFLKSMLSEVVENWITLETDEIPVTNKDDMKAILEEIISQVEKDAETGITEDSFNEVVKSRKKKSKRDVPQRAYFWKDQPLDERSTISENLEWRLNPPNEVAILEFKNGSTYQGEISNLLMHGQGEFKWADGFKYQGSFYRNTLDGLGRLEWPDSSWYDGDFQDGYRNGHGSYYKDEILVYQGEWYWGRKHGKGIIQFTSDESYDGYWSDDIPFGKGKRRYGNGRYYYGELENGKRSGFGMMVWPNNDVYKGYWKEGEMDGRGEYVWNTFFNQNFVYPIETYYHGNWVGGKRDGLGTMVFGYINGAKYEGDFRNGLKHGSGSILCGNGVVVKRDPLFLYDKSVHLTPDGFYANPVNRNEIFVYIPKDVARKTLKVDKDKLIGSGDSSSTSSISQMDEMKRDINYFRSQTIPIPIHSTSHLIDCSFYSSKIFTETIEFEENSTQAYLLGNLPKLWTIYGHYANICNSKISERSVMIRLFLWQLYRDCRLMKKISLTKIDLLFAENPSVYLETEHDPFEKIYFWQFLHSLIAVGLELYSKTDIVTNNVKGVIAGSLCKLLYDDIFPNASQPNGEILYHYPNLIPLDAMYNFYRSIGEPMSIREFILLCSERINGEPETIKKFYTKTLDGISTVLGNKYSYQQYQPMDSSADFENIKFDKFISPLKKLKISELIKCVAHICPLVTENQLIVNINYEIVFLEFVEVLIHCHVRYMEVMKEVIIKSLLMGRSIPSDLNMAFQESNLEFQNNPNWKRRLADYLGGSYDIDNNDFLGQKKTSCPSKFKSKTSYKARSCSSRGTSSDRATNYSLI